MKFNSILVVYADPINYEQKSSLNSVKNTLKKFKLRCSFVNRLNLSKKNFNERDLIIAIGGDGTFLKSSHFIKDKALIIGVNSDIKSKEGFYMKCSRFDFEKKMRRIMNNKFRILQLLRLQAKINSKEVGELALNEFYFGAEKSYLTSRYEIKIGHKSEHHRSSGVIVSTLSGARAWARACGFKDVSSDSETFIYIVREPFEYRLFRNYKFRSGILKKDNVIFKSEMLNSILIADSLSREYKLNYGDTVRIGVSDKRLSVISF